MGTWRAPMLCFQLVPIWEPRFLYSSHSGVTCHPFSRCAAPLARRGLPLPLRTTRHKWSAAADAAGRKPARTGNVQLVADRAFKNVRRWLLCPWLLQIRQVLNVKPELAAHGRRQGLGIAVPSVKLVHGALRFGVYPVISL